MEYSQQVSVNTLQRLPTYLNYLKSLDDDGNISSTEIARALGLNDVQVRKDLSSVSSGGRPKVGYNIRGLILDLKEFLGYNAVNDAVMVGCGNLGRALMSYRGFREYGLRIVAGFDVSDDIVGEEVSGKPVLPLSGLPQYCRENGIRIGVITTPAQAAQKAGELGDVRRFARALKADHHHDRRRVVGKGQARVRAAHQSRQLLVDDLDDLLGGGEAVEHLGADGALGNSGDKVLDDFVAHVCLEQRHAHLAHRELDVLLGQAALAAQAREDALQAIGKVIEHQPYPQSAHEQNHAHRNPANRLYPRLRRS